MSKWTFDPAHTVISFSARHMMVMNVRGSFKQASGTIWFDPSQPLAGKVDVEIDAASIDTGVADRDNHLKSPDFLDVANFPTLTFVSKHVEQTGEGEGVITGDLTIRGVTREVKLRTEFNGTATDPWGNEKAGFTATTRINREDWGLNWNVALETGGWLVGKEIRIDLEIEAAKVKEEVAEAAAV
jgi:polyisoprenoid-binding protein YceI